MPELTASITALLIERPTCLNCLTDKSGAAPSAVIESLRRIEQVLTMHRADADRCHACGEVGRVIFIDRPAIR